MRLLRSAWFVWCLALPLFSQNALDQYLAAARKARDDTQYDNAERQGAATIEQAEKLGPLSPRFNEALADLGTTYYAQRKYSQAEPLFFRATEIGHAAGVDGRTLATQLSNLGMLRHLLGRNEDALHTLERALKLREKSLGSEHPDLAFDLMNMANVQTALL